MGNIVGKSNQTEDIRDGTLALTKATGRVPAGSGPTATSQGPTLATLTKIKSIREKQEAILSEIKEMQEKLASLDDDGTTGIWSVELPSGVVLNYPVVLVWQNKTLKERLREEVKALRQHFRELEASARRLDLREAALKSAGAFNKDLAKLLDNALITGSLDMHQVEALRGKSDQAIGAWVEAVQKNPSSENIQGLLFQLGNAAEVGLDIDSEAWSSAWGALAAAGTKIKQSAEGRFRANPTSKKFEDYVKNAAISQQLGGEGLAQVTSAGPEKSYVVQPGDTLSGISKKFYGTTSLWDVIYLENLATIGKNPDRLPHNIKLTIP